MARRKPIPRPKRDRSSVFVPRHLVDALREEHEPFEREDLEAWLVEQVADPRRHEASDRERLTRTLRDVSLAGLGTRPLLLRLVGHMLDETAAVRRRGEVLDPTAYLLRALGLPSDFYERREAARSARRLEGAVPSSGNVRPLGREAAADLAQWAREIETLGDDPRYEDRALDASRSPLERALSRLLVERGDRYSDDDFDLTLEALSARGLSPPELSGEALRVFAVDWLEAVHALLRSTKDQGEISACDAVDLGVLCARVERRGGADARAHATRMIAHLFATRGTFAHSEEDLRQGRRPVLGKVATWWALLAEARTRCPDVPGSTWERMAQEPCRTVGAPTTDDLVRRAVAIAREPRPPTLAERVAVAAGRRLRHPSPTAAPGQCEQLRARRDDGRAVAEFCPASATTTVVDPDGTRQLCGPCAAVARAMWEANERALCHARTHRQGRRAVG